MKIKKASHCVYDINYHLVIVMKYRKKILLNEKYINFFCEKVKENFSKLNILKKIRNLI